MEVALTFGSVGDIISLCQIALALSRALGVGYDGASSSAKEYQDLRKDLDIFVKVLMQVVATYEQHEPSSALNTLDQVTKSVVDECGTLLQEAADRFIPRYHSSLQSGGSGRKIKDAYKKIEWSVREKERLHELRDKLRENTERLCLLTALAARKSARADNATVMGRIEHVRELLAEQETHRRTLLSHLQSHEAGSKEQGERLQRIDERLKGQELSNTSIVTSVSRAFAAIVQLKGMLADVADNVVHLQVLVSNSIFIRSLDPTRDLPITFEDAMGISRPLPLEWLNDWQDLFTLLELPFKNTEGYEMVRRRQFVLEEHCTGTDLDLARPLTACLRPGMKVNMSMVFVSSRRVQLSCPRCGSAADTPEGDTIQW